MSTQRYSVTPHPIETLLTWVKSGEIAIPEIQRPFVWEPVKVRNLLDSLYQGYPVGYLIAWRNPTVRLKDGSTSKGKRILIDGQQRVGSHERIGGHMPVAGHHRVAWPIATLGERMDPGGVAEGSRGLSAKRDTPGKRERKRSSTPKGSQIRPAREARGAEREWNRRAALGHPHRATNERERITAEQSFAQLKTGVLEFINKTHFDRFTMILRSAGYVISDLLRAQNAVNFAYVLYLRGRAEGMNAADLERLVRRWYVMSVLRGRYTGSPETAFDFDMRQIEARGLAAYTDAVIETELPESFWLALLPQEMDTSSTASPYFLAYQAAQVKLGDLGFLSRDITVRDLVLNRSDVHHVYPRNYLKKQGLTRTRYNQIANYVIAQSEINIAIGDKPPETYFADLAEQCNGGKKKYGGITDIDEMRANLRTSCLPESLLDGEVPEYDEFLAQRRGLMAAKMKRWYEGL